MKTKGIIRLAAATCAATLGVFATQGATTYEYPWYVNPTLRLRIDNGLEAGIVPCSVDAAGDALVMANNATDALNLRVITVDTILARDLTDDLKYGASADSIIGKGEILPNNRITHSGTGASTAYGLSAAPLVAMDAANDRFLAANADLSAVRLFNAKRDKWGVAGKANAPLAVTASETTDADCLSFGSDGATLYSNHAGGETRGNIEAWTLSGSALTKKASALATGLSVVRGFGVYAIDGADYAVAGEGDASAATQGTINLIKVSDGSVTTLVNDPAHLTGGIAAVKMSHADSFRPRVYALLDTGDVVVYYSRKEKGTCPWSATFSNAELLALSQCPYAATEAKVTQFVVSASGEVALVGYTRTGGTTSGKPTFAFLYHTATPWTYYAAGAAGNPCSTGGACITDGKWVLTMATTGIIGASNSQGAAYDGDDMGEVLDLSIGYSTDSANATKTYNFNMNYNWALGSKNGKGPRIILPPSRQVDWVQFTKGWNCTDYYEEVVIDFTYKTGWNPWANLFSNMQRIVINAPAMTQIKDRSLFTNNTSIPYGACSRWEDFNFPVAYRFDFNSVAYCLAAGKLTLPLVQTIGNQAFFNDYNMTEVSLSENQNLLTSVGYRAFGLADGQKGSLKRVVLGCKAGCTFSNQVFYKQPIEEIVFTGAKPTVSGSSGWDRWCDEKEKQLTFVVPRNAEWEAVIAGKVTPLTDAERQAFHLAHPGRYVPFGVLSADAMGSSLSQYVAYLDDTGYCALKIERDDFFEDDAVEIAPDHEAASDGTYLTGTKVTLTAKPGSTGTFRKWYGGPFAGTDETAKNATVTITLGEDTWLYCRIVHPWTLSGDKKTMSNGNFTINCAVADATSVKIGKNERCGLYANDDTGYGVCDLGGDIVEAGGETTYAATGWGMNVNGSMLGERAGKGNAHTLLFPETALLMPDKQFLHGTATGWTGRSYETWIVDAPDLGGRIECGWMTCGQFHLNHVVLQVPKLTAILSEANFWNVPMNGTKLDWWDLSEVARIESRAIFGWDWGHALGNAHGALALPALTSTEDDTKGYKSLQKAMKIETLSIGGKTKKTTVTTLVAYSFYGDAALKRMTLHNDPAMTVGAKALENCSSLKEIVLTGKPFASETPLANLLDSVTAAATKPLKVYVSGYNGWGFRPAYLDEPTEAEHEEAAGEIVLGVYRGGAAAPNGKALFVHRNSPFDPKGGVVILK